MQTAATIPAEAGSPTQNDFVNPIDFAGMKAEWQASKPFNNIVIDDFLKPDAAQTIAGEFPLFDDPVWRIYDNAIEVKKLLNHYDKFGAMTYRLFHQLNSPEFIAGLESMVGCKLYPDIGLNGGGLHTHKQGGKLNVHLDYSIHPKLGLERRLNLIIYITPGWKPAWGGALGLWEHNAETEQPGEMGKSVDCLFNRAVLFDTTQNSWHGLPELITCPEGVYRNSLAVYYLCEPRPAAPGRGKALFAPYKEQSADPAVLELIRKRSSVASAADVYGDKK